MKYFLVLMICLITISCKQKSVQEKDIDIVLELDAKFSDICEKEGYYAALTQFYDSTNIVRLEPNREPVVGGSVMSDLESRKSDYKDYTFKFSADNAMISDDKTMAFVYGIYAAKHKISLTETKGTYVNIWKKNEKGDWRIVFDTGNNGLKPEDENATSENNKEENNSLGEFKNQEELDKYLQDKVNKSSEEYE